jgi:hypothetical protein
MAKRLVKSCFPPEVPVPQLQPLDARNIIKHRSYQVAYQMACEEASKYPCERWKGAYEVPMNVSFKPKPISDEDAWEAALAWAEAKAQEREALATKAVSQTNTDESYDSDDTEVGVSIQPVRSKPSLFGDDFGDDSDEDEDEDEYEDDNEDDDDIEEFARTIWEQIAAMIAIWGAKERAATMIQAAARGRAVRAWNPFVFAPTVSHIDTDESYDSDDFAEEASAPPPKPKLPAGAAAGGPLAAMAGLMRVGDVVRANVYSLNDAAAAAAMWRDDVQADAYECVAAKKALEALDKWLPSPRKYTAATIIQAAERGRVVRMVRKVPSLFGDDSNHLFGDDSKHLLGYDDELFDDVTEDFEMMRAQLVALQALVTTLENEKMAMTVVAAALQTRVTELEFVDVKRRAASNECSIFNRLNSSLLLAIVGDTTIL